MTTLTPEQLFGQTKTMVKKGSVTLQDGTEASYHVRRLTAGEKNRFEHLIRKGDLKYSMREIFVLMTWCDERGNLKIQPKTEKEMMSTIESLSVVDGTILEAIVEDAMTFNAVSEADLKDMLGNSTRQPEDLNEN